MSDVCNKCNAVIEDKKISAKCSECSSSYHLNCCGLKSAEVWRKRGGKSTWRCDSCMLESASSVSKSDNEGTDNVMGVLQKLRKDISDNMKETRGRFDGIDKNIESLRSSIDESKVKIAALESENQTLRMMCESNKADTDKVKKEAARLRSELLDLQQYTRRNNLEIKGIPPTHGEDPYIILECIAKALDVPWFRGDISVAHRLQHPRHGGQPSIIAAFVSRCVKEDWLAAAREKKLTTKDISHKLAPGPVFIFNHLTVHNKQLLYRARMLVRERKLANAWTVDGKVLVRKMEGGRGTRVCDLEDLEKLTTESGFRLDKRDTFKTVFLFRTFRRSTFTIREHIFSICSIFIVLADEQEYRLTKYLMANYDASVRPAENSSVPLKVIFGISLHHIIDVDEKNQILTTNCWLTQIWEDHHLKWNASDFAGIKVIRVPYNRVWKPDTILYNNADSQYSSAVINTNVIVSSNGEVVWLSHGIYRSSCDIDVEYFPFDIQSCNMKWASWTYDGYQLDLVKQSEEGDVSNYQANGEFDLVSFDPVKHVEFYSCCPEPYPDITYVIRLRRRPMFYVFNLILPCILINCIALLVFYVPSESGEKVTLGISALLSMTVFLMTIRETLPPTEKTPLISMYYGVSICLVSFASGLSVVTLNVYHRGVRGTKVPPIIKNLILGKLARIVMLQFEPRDKHQSDINSRTGTRLDCPRPERWTSMEDGEYQCNNLNLNTSQLSPRFINRHRLSRTETSPDSFEAQFLRVLHRVNCTIERNEIRLAEQERRECTEIEWKQVALVCDRFLLWVFLITTAITTTVILCGSPYGP